MARTDTSSILVETEGLEAVTIDASPGNGTRYRLSLVVEGNRVHSLAWPDTSWSAGDFNLPVSGEWLASRSRAVGRADGEAIAELVNARPWGGSAAPAREPSRLPPGFEYVNEDRTVARRKVAPSVDSYGQAGLPLSSKGKP